VCVTKTLVEKKQKLTRAKSVGRIMHNFTKLVVSQGRLVCGHKNLGKVISTDCKALTSCNWSADFPGKERYGTPNERERQGGKEERSAGGQPERLGGFLKG